MKAKDEMTANPFVLSDDATIEEALGRFATVPYRVLPIVHASGSLIGYVSLEDILSTHKSIIKRPIIEMYISIPVTVSPEKSLQSVVGRIFEKEVDHIFVVGYGGELLGVVAVIDIARKQVHYYSGQAA